MRESSYKLNICLGALKNRLFEVLLSTKNKCFVLEILKIISKLRTFY